MTTVLSPRAQPAAALSVSAQLGVLKIAGMPKQLRARVESIIVECVRTESIIALPGQDPLTAQWFTHWFIDSPVGLESEDAVVCFLQAGRPSVRRFIGCHQVISGTVTELTELQRHLSELAERYGFRVEVDTQEHEIAHATEI
ncbi:MAG: hypothetical protein SOW59_01260 [Corynebacterium sp.]|nr:hypothetical protein [Corynebacterium sp.]